MKRTAILVYGLFSYLVGLISLTYMIGWLGNLVPGSIDSEPVSYFGEAAAINLFVFMAFCIQHSVMARPAFKAWWTKIIPQAAERSTYVLASGLAMLLLMFSWQPMGGAIWSVEYQPLRCVIHTIYLAGWVVLVGSTFALNHFDLFGLRQVLLEFQGKAYTPLEFKTPGPYRLVRHPLYVGWLTLAWATPNMTIAHLAFAVLTTTYILVAIRWEERDLVDHHGDDYLRYRAETPMLIPALSARQEENETPTSLPAFEVALFQTNPLECGRAGRNATEEGRIQPLSTRRPTSSVPVATLPKGPKGE